MLVPKPGWLSKTHLRTNGKGAFSGILLEALPITGSGETLLCLVRLLRKYKELSEHLKSGNSSSLICSYIASNKRPLMRSNRA